jgi:hypothetical protein
MKRFYLCAVLFCSSCVCVGQQADLPSSLSTPDNAQQSQDSGQSLGDLARRARKDHSEETEMTPEDAKKLFAAVDRITTFAAEDSGFPQHGPVKRQLIAPADIEKLMRERLSRDDHAERYARAELTMKKFGLLPRDFNMKEFMIKAERKDIVAFYDDETKSISMVNTIPLAEQEAVLAHELTHALQDQNYDLHTWGKPSLKDAKGNPVSDDEGSDARRAVIEGQATVVFTDYLLARVGRNVQNTPGIIYRMEDPSIKGTIDTPMMHDAPMILREAGTFPYHEGLIFEGELLQAGGKQMAFAGAFAHPPKNTHEVIQPRAYLDHEKLPGLPFPDARALLQDEYEVFDSGSVGELDVRALLWQYSGRTLADDLSKDWRGGAYVALHKKSAAAATTSDLKLYYVSRWNTDLAAQRFAKFYGNAVTRRYQTASPASSTACVGSDCPLSTVQFTTEEGPVMIELWKNDTVVISEGFDADTAAKLNSATRENSHKAAASTVPQRELGMRLYDLPAFREWQAQLEKEIAGLSTSR